MNQIIWLNRAKRISAILLLLCLFMPLSQCTTVTQDREKQETIQYDYTIQYAYTMYKWPSIGAISIISAMTWPLVFVITSLAYNRHRENIYLYTIEIIFCLGSAYMLTMALIFQTKLLIGGYLAIISLFIYFVTTVALLVGLIRNRKKTAA